jgi:hypothetical protein
MAQTPIANKYHEGKMQRTLKRESKVPEIVEGEPVTKPVSRDRITVLPARLGYRWVPTGIHLGG